MAERDEKQTEKDIPVAASAAKRSRFHKTKSRIRLYRRLNQPLSVTVLGGIIVFLITSFVQQRYATSQQEFLVEQSRRAHRIESASATEKEIIHALSKRFTGIAVVVGAYAGHYGKEQYRDNVDYYTASKREWDREQEVLELKVSTYFSDQRILKSWEDLVKKLENFDASTVALNDQFRGITKDSTKLKEALASADKEIDSLEIDLKAFSHQLNDFINREEARPL
jgi:hypothetical protein